MQFSLTVKFWKPNIANGWSMKMISRSVCFVTLSLALISLAPSCNSAQNKKRESIITLPTCCPLDLSQGQCDSAKKGKIHSWNMPSHLMSTKNATEFRLEQKVSECKNKGTLVILQLNNVSKNETVLDYFLPDGYLKIGSQYYPRQEYCLNGTNGNKTVTNLIIKVCEPSCGERTPCIKKCCPLHQLFSLGRGGVKMGCVDHNGLHASYMPTFYRNYDTKLSDKESQNIFPHFYHYGSKQFPKCTKLLTPYGKSVVDLYNYYNPDRNLQGKNFKFTKNGHLLYRKAKGDKCNKLDHFKETMCFDGIINYSDNGTVFSNDEEETMYFTCATDQQSTQTERALSPVYGSLLLSSSIFAFLTILVYLLLWKRQNFRGWIIVSQAVSLFFTNIFLGSGHVMKINEVHFYTQVLGTPGCIFVGYATHFFFLSMFCWITVTGFDLWFTFRELKPSHSESEGRRRLVLYSCFAWGVPTIVVTVGAILQNFADESNCGDSDMHSSVVSPGYGMEVCYLSVNALGPYLYYPATVMMALNIIFFCVTIYKFYKYRKGTRMATKDESLKQFYMLSIKLFVVMGVTWLFEIISFYHNVVGQTWHWVLFDVMNCLRPIAFFVIFVCKPDIIAALRDNYACLKPLLGPCSRVFPRITARSDSENVTMTTGLSTKRSFSESRKNGI